MNDYGKVSIIVPIYNVEKYVSNTINSLIQQSYTNIEIILVDDGSTDESFKVMSENSRNDERIKIIQKKNSGVSATRNVGINASTGKYIMFVDGDDVVDTDYVEYFLNLITSGDYKMAIGTDHYTVLEPSQNSYITTYVENAEKIISNIYTGKIYMAVWNKIYLREFLIDKQIWFDENIWYSEGMLFNIRCLSFLDEIIVGNKKTYHYIYNNQSAMRLFKIENEYCAIESLGIQHKILETCGKYTKSIGRAHNYHICCVYGNIINGIIRINDKQRYLNEYKEAIVSIRKRLLCTLLVDISIKRKLYWALFAVFPGVMARRDKKKFLKTASLAQ